MLNRCATCSEPHRTRCERCGSSLHAGNKTVELDVAGNPKAELTVLEDQAITVLNTIKGMVDGGFIHLPVEVQMKIDAVLMMATVRRVGVR